MFSTPYLSGYPSGPQPLCILRARNRDGDLTSIRNGALRNTAFRTGALRKGTLLTPRDQPPRPTPQG